MRNIIKYIHSQGRGFIIPCNILAESFGSAKVINLMTLLLLRHLLIISKESRYIKKCKLRNAFVQSNGSCTAWCGFSIEKGLQYCTLLWCPFRNVQSLIWNVRNRKHLKVEKYIFCNETESNVFLQNSFLVEWI